MPQSMPFNTCSNIYNFIDRIGNSKFIKAMTFIIISFFIFSFFLLFNGKNKYINETPAFQSNSIIVPASGEELRQKIIPLASWINGISLQFGTYMRTNHGTLHVSFSKDNQTIKSWQISLQELQDNVYQEFYFDKAIQIDTQKNYFITVMEEYAGQNNAVAIYAEDFGSNSEKKMLYEPLQAISPKCDNKVLCTKTFKYNFTLRRIVIALSLILFFTLLGLVISKTKTTIIMSFLLIITGILWFLVLPGGAVPDEPGHFYRAFDISRGIFLANKSLNARAVPKAIPNFFSHGSTTVFSQEDARIDWEDTVNMRETTVALYSPISYLPQAAAIYISQLFTDKVKTLFYAARAGGCILSILFIILAIYVIPFGKKIIFLLAMSPMVMQEIISLAPDGVLIGLTFFIFSLVLKLAFSENTISKKNMLVTTALFLLLSQYKILYIPLISLVFMIPDKNYACKKHKRYLRYVLPACAVICALLWIGIVSYNKYLIEFRPGVNSGKQVIFILTHPLAFYKTIIRTLTTFAVPWLLQIAGDCLGWLNITHPETFVFAVIILYCYEACTAKDIPPMSFINMGILLSASVIIILLIFAALYVQWTPLGWGIIEGIQGRYFIPIVPELLFFVHLLIKGHSSGNSTSAVSTEYLTYSYIIMLTYNMTAVVQVMFFYKNHFI